MSSLILRLLKTFFLRIIVLCSCTTVGSAFFLYCIMSYYRLLNDKILQMYIIVSSILLQFLFIFKVLAFLEFFFLKNVHMVGRYITRYF